MVSDKNGDTSLYREDQSNLFFRVQCQKVNLVKNENNAFPIYNYELSISSEFRQYVGKQIIYQHIVMVSQIFRLISGEIIL